MFSAVHEWFNPYTLTLVWRWFPFITDIRKEEQSINTLAVLSCSASPLSLTRHGIISKSYENHGQMVHPPRLRGTLRTSRSSNKMWKVKNKKQIPLGHQNQMHTTAFRLPISFQVCSCKFVCSPPASDQVPSVYLNTITVSICTPGKKTNHLVWTNSKV